MISALVSFFTYSALVYVILNEIFIGWVNSRSGATSSHPYKYSSWFRNIKYFVAWVLVTLENRRQWKRHITDEEGRIGKMERPQILEIAGPHANNSIAFTGSDQEGNQVLIRFARRHNNVWEFWLILKIVDENGHAVVYEHPEHPNCVLFNAEPNAFAAGGLRFRMVEPMKKWKITYNGWMRKGIRQSLEEKDTLDGLVQTKIEFEWTAVSKPFYFHHQLDPSLIAGAMADQCWSKEFFQHLKENSTRGYEVRYEQFGEISGMVTFENTPAVHMRVIGMRDHNAGPRDWRHFKRYIANMGIVQDGTFFHVGAVSIKGALEHLLFGYVGDSSGELWPLTSSSIDLARLGDDGSPPDDFTMSFTANNKQYFFKTHVQDRIHVFNGLGWPSHSNVQFMKIELNGSVGYGFCEFEYENIPGKEIDPKAIRDSSALLEEIALDELLDVERKSEVVPLGHRLALCREMVGDRTQQLAQLWKIQGKFSIPRGMVITPNAFRIDQQNSDMDETKVKNTIHAKLKEIFTNHVQALSDGKPVTIFYSGQEPELNEDRVEVSTAEQFIQAILNFPVSNSIGKPGLMGHSIVVQETIPGDSCGEIWTCHPKRKSPAGMAVTVKKDGQTKEYSLKRNYNNQLTCDSPAGKHENGVMKLAQIGLHLEKSFRSPLRIGYTESDGVTYICQCYREEQ